MSHEIPICPECGKIAELLDDNEIFCQDCWDTWWNELRRMLGKEGMAQIIYSFRQKSKLGIDMDKQPSNKNFPW